jgi:DNA-binding winged helix-turn-helix (wHTH) protein
MSVYEVGPFHLRAERLALTCRGKAVPIGRKVVETLLGLVEARGPVSKEDLMERVWPHSFVEESNLAQNVYVLRKTFREYGGTEPIETIPGYGYRLTVAALRAPEHTAILRPARPRLRPAWIAIALFAIATIPAVLALSAGSFRLRAEPPALSAEGARFYALGRYYWNLRSAAGVQKSVAYFARVIDRDPESPLGYVGMADANVTIGDYCYGTHRPSVYFARAHAFAVKAVSLDPLSAPAHATLGLVALHQGESAAATAELRRAIALDPSYAAAHEWYGIALARQNNVREGWQQLRLAAQLDPLSVATMTWLSRLAGQKRRFADAANYREEATDMSPEVARRRSPPGHPTWASIENLEHGTPTASGRPAYSGYETLSVPRSRAAAGRAGSSVLGNSGSSHQE